MNTNHNHDHHHHRHDHSHDSHHHYSDTNGNPNNQIHHNNSTEQNLNCSNNNNCNPNSAPSIIRKKSNSLIMEMSLQNPAYTAELNPEKRQDSIEKQIDNIHVDFGLSEDMMTPV